MFPGNRPATVTNDPEIAKAGSQVTALNGLAKFPGDRYAATADVLRDGATTVARPATNMGYAPVPDTLRDGDANQTNNTRIGGEYKHATVSGTVPSPLTEANPQTAYNAAIMPEGFPNGRPTVAADNLRDGDSHQANNTTFGGAYAHPTAGGAVAPYTEDPDHKLQTGS